MCTIATAMMATADAEATATAITAPASSSTSTTTATPLAANAKARTKTTTASAATTAAATALAAESDSPQSPALAARRDHETRASNASTDCPENLFDLRGNFSLEHGDKLCRRTCATVCRRFFRKAVCFDDNGEVELDAITAADVRAATLGSESWARDEADQRLALLRNVEALCAKLTADEGAAADGTVDLQTIDVQIRSVPVQMYGNALRHYYLRIENLLDVHPGTRHRLALAWWHNATMLETDSHERSLRLCGECCDRLLDYVWRGSESFNMLWGNCDQLLNHCRQSFVLGMLVFSMLWYALFHDAAGSFIMIAVSVLVFLLSRRANSRHAAHRNVDRLYVCQHLLAAHQS